MNVIYTFFIIPIIYQKLFLVIIFQNLLCSSVLEYLKLKYDSFLKCQYTTRSIFKCVLNTNNEKSFCLFISRLPLLNKEWLKLKGPYLFTKSIKSGSGLDRIKQTDGIMTVMFIFSTKTFHLILFELSSIIHKSPSFIVN